MKASEFFHLSGIEMKASKVIYFKYKITRRELNILVSLSAYLMLFDKKIIGRNDFSEWLGLNYKMERKVFYYVKCLIDKGAIHRLAYRRPDGNCLTISGFGLNVLEAFDQVLKAIQKAEKLKNPFYKNLSIDLENLPKGYTLMQRGRDS